MEIIIIYLGKNYSTSSIQKKDFPSIYMYLLKYLYIPGIHVQRALYIELSLFFFIFIFTNNCIYRELMPKLHSDNRRLYSK